MTRSFLKRLEAAEAEFRKRGLDRPWRSKAERDAAVRDFMLNNPNQVREMVRRLQGPGNEVHADWSEAAFLAATRADT